PLIITSTLFPTTTLPTQLYTLSLHDALPIFASVTTHRVLASPGPFSECNPYPIARARESESILGPVRSSPTACRNVGRGINLGRDRKSTRLNSSHVAISYAVFCLKKKNEHEE